MAQLRADVPHQRVGDRVNARRVSLALAAATAGCASVPASAVDICRQIAQFANSSRDHLVHRVEITRDVKTPMVMEAAALYGDTTHEAAEKLGDLSSIREDVGGLDLSPIVLFLILGFIQRLVNNIVVGLPFYSI